MSRIGKNGIKVPADVKVIVNNNHVVVSGKLGQLERIFDEEVSVKNDGNEYYVLPSVDIKNMPNKKQSRYKSKWGLSRSLFRNMIIGVSLGFHKRLEINGVGYKASVDNKFLTLNLGYSHAIKFLIPKDIKIVAEKPTVLLVSGISKQKVGQISALIRSQREPEPYKGKGIKYEDEIIIRKEVKNKK